MYVLATGGGELMTRFILNAEEKLLFHQEDKFFTLGRYSNESLQETADIKLTLARLDGFEGPEGFCCHASLEMGTFRNRDTVSLEFRKNHRTILEAQKLERLGELDFWDPSYPRDHGGTFLRLGDALEMIWITLLKEPTIEFDPDERREGIMDTIAYVRRNIQMRVLPLFDINQQKQESRLLHLPEVALKEVISHLPAQYALETLPGVCQRFLVMSEEKIDWKPPQKVQITCGHLQGKYPKTPELHDNSRLLRAVSKQKATSLAIMDEGYAWPKLFVDIGEEPSTTQVFINVQPEDYCPSISSMKGCDWSTLTCLELYGETYHFQLVSRLRDGIMEDNVFRGLQELTVCFEDRCAVNLIPRVLYSKLKRLKMSIGGETPMDITGADFFQQMPNLTNLDLLVLEPDTLDSNFHIFMLDALLNGSLQNVELLGIKYRPNLGSQLSRMEHEHILREEFPPMPGVKVVKVDSAASISMGFKDIVADRFPNIQELLLNGKCQTWVSYSDEDELNGQTQYKLRKLQMVSFDRFSTHLTWANFKELEDIHLLFTEDKGFQEPDHVFRTMELLAKSSLKKVQRLSLKAVRKDDGPNIFAAFCDFLAPRVTWDLRSLAITGRSLFCVDGRHPYQFRRLFAQFPNLEDLEFDCTLITDAVSLAGFIGRKAKNLKSLKVRCHSMPGDEKIEIKETFRSWTETTGGVFKIE